MMIALHLPAKYINLQPLPCIDIDSKSAPCVGLASTGVISRLLSLVLVQARSREDWFGLPRPVLSARFSAG